MEVNEAIEFLENYNIHGDTKMIYGYEFKQFNQIIDLLKSLESENKKLKKENEAYKGMWKSLIALENKLKKQFGLR